MNSYPQVLLLGNGINLLHNMYSWKDVLRKINVNPHISVDDLTSPMPLQAILVTNDNINNILKDKAKDKNSDINFYGKISSEEQRKQLQKLLCMGFDHILTTNYSYELELAGLSLQSDISDYQFKKISNHTSAVEKVEPKYMLHSFNQVTYNDVENKIWHIHGEARKIDSMVLGHYQYGSLFSRIKHELEKTGKEYIKKQEKDEPIEIQSWMDAFILGDVHILGFGFDTSEFDLWWLINRKKREKASHGKIYFYEPIKEDFDERIELLKALDVEIQNYGIVIPEKLSEDASISDQRKRKEEISQAYLNFYLCAMDDIKKRIANEEQ